MVSDAPSDSPYFMDFTLTMPYSKVQFEAQHVKYTAAVASAASAPVSNVEIVSVTEKPHFIGRSVVAGQFDVDVETKVRAKDSEDLASVTSALGSGDAFKSKINSALEAQGLEEATNAAAQGRQHARRLSTHSERRGANALLKDFENDRVQLDSPATSALQGSGSAHAAHASHVAHKNANNRAQMLLQLFARAKRVWRREGINGRPSEKIEKAFGHTGMDKVKEEEVPLKSALNLEGKNSEELDKKTEANLVAIVDFVARNYVVCTSVQIHTYIRMHSESRCMHACMHTYIRHAYTSSMYAYVHSSLCMHTHIRQYNVCIRTHRACTITMCAS